MPPNRVRVYWDLENCIIPSGLDEAATIQRIRNLTNERGWGQIDKKIRAYCDFRKASPGLQPAEKREELEEWGKGTIEFVHCPHDGGQKNVVDKRIITNMIAYATNQITPNERITIVLITGDGDFADAVLSLRFLKHTVILIASVGNLSHRLKQSASEFLSWEEDVIDKVPKKAPGGRGATSVHERPPFCGAMSLGSLEPLGPPVYHQPLHAEEPEYYEAGSSAQFLIPRSFEVLIRCLQGAPRPEPLSYLRPRLEAELGQLDDKYIRDAEGLDIIQLHQGQLPTGCRDLLVTLKQPWWDGFD